MTAMTVAIGRHIPTGETGIGVFQNSEISYLLHAYKHSVGAYGRCLQATLTQAVEVRDQSNPEAVLVPTHTFVLDAPASG